MSAPRWYRAGARARGVTTLAGPLLFVAALVSGYADLLPGTASVVLAFGGFVLVLVGLALTFVPFAPALEPRAVQVPVAGRWVALNSPATKVPSHGTHGHGQTFAIDLAYEPEPGSRPEFGKGPAVRPPTDFPAFGQPVYAPADGRVVAVRATARDHGSRSTWPAIAWLMLAGSLRELGGSRFLLGNHVVLDVGGGVFALVAHLQRGSVDVTPGSEVRAGDRLAACGNSGNSSEPHVHFHLMDGRHAFSAAGLPFSFPRGVPADGEAISAGAQPPG